jgi:hypothetical protein
MSTNSSFSNATYSPLPFALSGVPAKSKRGEGLGRRVEPVETVRSVTKRQIEVTMFACGVEKLEGLKVGKLANVDK